MNLLKLQNHVLFSFHFPQITLPISSLSSPNSIPHDFNYFPTFPKISSFPSKSFPKLNFSDSRVSKFEALACKTYEEEDGEENYEDLSENSVVYRKTLRLVECAMFAGVSGLAYFLSDSLGMERHFGLFFALPIVISSMRWGVGAGRKTMVATAMLLLVLSGPLKALTYLLRNGLVGFTMGFLWRSGANWSLLILLCTFVRAMGVTGYVLIASFLIRENLLALITKALHGYLTYIYAAIGINSVPSMSSTYAIFGTLVLFNCGFFVFLLHILYAIFLTRLGMKPSLTLPRWLEKAM